MAIKVNKIDIVLVEHFTPTGESLGFLNEYESLDLRVQIVKEQVEGYYFVFNGEKTTIDKMGELSKWPKGLWDVPMILYAELLKARKPYFDISNSLTD